MKKKSDVISTECESLSLLDFFFQPHIFVEASPLFLITGRPHSHGKNTGTAPPCILSLSLSLSQVQDLFAFICMFS